MISANPNPILAVHSLGHTTPLGVAADRAGWEQLDAPTPRELLRTLFLRSHRVVVLGLGRVGQRDTLAEQAGQLLQALHTSSHTPLVIAAGFDADETTERAARNHGVALYLNPATPEDLIAAAHAMLPRRRDAATAAPVSAAHPTLPDPNHAPRAHLLAALPAHPYRHTTGRASGLANPETNRNTPRPKRPTAPEIFRHPADQSSTAPGTSTKE